jgi:hypothetical protein
VGVSVDVGLQLCSALAGVREALSGQTQLTVIRKHEKITKEVTLEEMQ